METMTAERVIAAVVFGEALVIAPLPPSMNPASINARNASALSKLVMFCVVLPQPMPCHCSSAKKIATAAATIAAFPSSAGMRAPLNVPFNSDPAAVEPHDEIQSLQPTTNPAYSPSA